MDFSKPYNRTEFVNYLRRNFLPDDFEQEEHDVPFWTQMNYASSALKLGICPSLELVVYEIKHTSHNDARVGLSKDAFRMLAGEKQRRALVIFVPEDTNDNYRFSLIEIQLTIGENDSNVTRTYSNPRRYSYFLGKGIACYTPNKYLNKLGKVVDEKDLFDRFSVEVLTKAFYNELSDWYAWAIKEISFPNDLTTTADDTDLNHTGAIRLITRLIFVWFLKQKHLIPDEFFDEKYIAENLIDGFNPHKVVDIFGKSTESRYYKAILQNLFFAMLNAPLCKDGSKEITERKFKDNRGQFDDNKLMRYRSLFKNPDLFLQLANSTVPFLNGGLFDCLDDKKTGMYYEGFSERKESMAQLRIPDYLFFGEEVGRDIDLSEYYGDKNKKKVSARGIIDILKRYNFTVEENMPFDKDISLDPELLGKVFENLLASYNPETKTTARKQTGSFYTPREIVKYMVDESLVAHLKRTVGEELESEYRKLLSYADDEINLTESQRQSIMQSLYNCRILDPACGSGAFPVGILQQMVHILTQIDSDNSRWQKMLFDIAQDESSEVFKNSTEEERKEQLDDLYNSFNTNFNNPDYSRKLYLIENCIYGVDIQPIAIQISKLRFFISLIIDQKPNNDPADNFGIRPLPNLEAKFVAANSLIGLKREEEDNLFNTAEIKEKEKQLKIAKHKIFSAKTARTKRKYENQVMQLRNEIAEMLVAQGLVGNEQAQHLTQWDMCDQNATSPFFDPEWMFGIKDGFDIVIANPPYVLLQNMSISTSDKDYLTNNYYVAQYKVDLYHLFYEKGLTILREKGILAYITPISFLKNKYNNKLRHKLVSESTICTIVRFFIPIFEASVDNVILICAKGLSPNSVIKRIDVRNSLNNLHKEVTDFVYQNTIIPPSYNFEIDIKEENELLCKIEHNLPLKLFVRTYFGIQTFDRKNYVSKFKKDEYYQPVIDGGNILPYKLIPSCEFVNFSSSAIKSGGNPTVYNQERIVVRQIGAYPEGCICPPGLYTLNTIYNIYLWNDRLPIKYILGMINSKLIHYYWSLKYSDSKKTFPKIKKEPLESIPIYEPANKDICKIIVSYVNKIMSAKDRDGNANTTEYETTIDKIVYQLYGLTYDEVKIIDPDTPITREEYDNFNFDAYGKS